MILVILLYMLFASTFTLGKAVLTYIQPIMFIGIRKSYSLIPNGHRRAR